MMYCQAAVSLTDSSQVGDARRHAMRLAADCELNDEAIGKIAIVATELANNLLKHATDGEFLLRSIDDGKTSGVELLAIDRGPGMANVADCLRDGYSTTGTPGTGLGAIARLSTEFDIYSHRPGGTVVMSRITSPPSASPYSDGLAWGVINRPSPRETVSGDTWRLARYEDGFTFMVVDGLGHGPLAADAAAVAASVFEDRKFPSLAEYFSTADQRMRGTRGAAVAVARYDGTKNVLHYSGIGNIAGNLRSQRVLGNRGLASHNGIVGAEMRRTQQFDYDCPDDPLLIMHSDGLQARWTLDAYPGLLQRHPAIIAAVLYRDFYRGRDDVTVGVLRFTAGTGEKG